MRERLTAAVCLLTLALLTIALGARAFALDGQVREEAGLRLTQELRLVARVVADTTAQERPVDESLLVSLVPSTARLELDSPGREPLVATGPDYAGDGEGDLVAELPVEAGTLRLGEDGGRVAEVLRGDVLPVLVLLTSVLVLAVLGSLVVARWLARPFRDLAVAAGDLGRGRFEPALPDSRVREAQQVAEALRDAGARLQARQVRERVFAQRASHELRTPLFRVRLALEELGQVGRDDPEVAPVVARSLSAVADCERVADELVAAAGRDEASEGALVSLQDLAVDLAQRWADRLADRGRRVTAAVEGELDLSLSAGPVEHVLELLLEEVVRVGRGETRLVFEARADDPVRVHVVCEAARSEASGGDRLEVPRRVASSLGGRLHGSNVVDGLELLLPRR